LHSPLLGPFNLLNLLACIALLGGLGFDLSALLRSARSAVGAPGRMQLVHQGEVRVIVDYAHTPDALEQVLQALRPHVDGHLHLVFGCGGNRDVGKRPLMGAIAESLADRVVVTSDNPRDELPEAIVDGICGGMQCLENITIEVDRGRAIRHALGAAVPGDMVVIAGKGHESYQEISGERRPFSDRQCVEHYYASPARAQR
jgi:UDP-N-acetylmuramoyl-L-alanyl-D-glutamate--2,6-diaminopimelate ligase